MIEFIIQLNTSLHSSKLENFNTNYNLFSLFLISSTIVVFLTVTFSSLKPLVIRFNN